MTEGVGAHIWSLKTLTGGQPDEDSIKALARGTFGVN